MRKPHCRAFDDFGISTERGIGGVICEQASKLRGLHHEIVAQAL